MGIGICFSPQARRCLCVTSRSPWTYPRTACICAPISASARRCLFHVSFSLSKSDFRLANQTKGASVFSPIPSVLAPSICFCASSYSPAFGAVRLFARFVLYVLSACLRGVSCGVCFSEFPHFGKSAHDTTRHDTKHGAECLS